ncbi:nuclear RNA export factor 3 [Castor canadensis]|uniref:Nuclear RNA export factor 3 n=1 Tax=Castor canadensis TaxID=51338 RepID=A0AC58LME9_CASCN
MDAAPSSLFLLRPEVSSFAPSTLLPPLLRGAVLRAAPKGARWPLKLPGIKSSALRKLPTRHNSQNRLVQRRARCWGLFRRRFPNWSEQVSATMLTSYYRQQDGAPARSDALMESRERYTPYGIPSHHRRVNLHGNMEGEENPPERRMERNRQDETLRSWFKITIPFGIKYEEKWLLNLIQSQCSVPFTPVEFHYEQMQAQFFVENGNIAFELRNISGKIWDEDNEKISIFISPSGVPHTVQQELKPEKMEQIKLMVNRCDAFQQDLNTQQLPSDPDLMTHTMEVALTPKRYMITSKPTHEENIFKLFPLNLSHNKPYQLVALLDAIPMTPSIKPLNVSKNEVISAWNMNKGKWLQPAQMFADRNSICTTFPDKSTNINSILESFPKLLCLDNQETPRPALCDTKAHKSLPICKGSFFGSEMLKTLVLQFLQQYYFIYDYGDRRNLFNAYHEEAFFSLTILSNFKDSALSSLCEYLKHTRNVKTLKDPYVQTQLLKHKKCDIVNSLCMLPKTQHNFSSFVVDMWFQTETILCFSVNGVFKEVEGKSQGCVHVFTRTFITTPGSSSSLCIVNDKLFVKTASLHGTQNTFSIPMPISSSSSGPALSQERQRVMQTFSTQSWMNLEWSQRCSHDNCWNYSRPAQVLALPKRMAKSNQKMVMPLVGPQIGEDLAE